MKRSIFTEISDKRFLALKYSLLVGPEVSWFSFDLDCFRANPCNHRPGIPGRRLEEISAEHWDSSAPKKVDSRALQKL